MRTSELAGQAGINAETLRYYERRGLLAEPPRTAGGYRDYPAAAVDLLRFIKRAQELGFTLDEVEELLHLDHGGPDSCDAARALAQARRADLEARIADLTRMRDSLTDLITTCELPRAERRCPLLTAINNQHRSDQRRSDQHRSDQRRSDQRRSDQRRSDQRRSDQHLDDQHLGDRHAAAPLTRRHR